MQFTENSALGLRASVLTLSHPSHPTQFMLCPVVRIGERAYYEAVKARIAGCDALIHEGVRSFAAALLTQAYTLVARRKRLGYVLLRLLTPNDLRLGGSLLAQGGALTNYGARYLGVTLLTPAAFGAAGAMVFYLVGRYLVIRGAASCEVLGGR